MEKSQACLYTIYDRIAEESSPPFLARTDGVAIRHYLAAMQNKDITPDDFWLYKIGGYDTADMRLQALTQPMRVLIKNKEVEA